MKRVTVCCKQCRCYYDIEAWDEFDLKDPICLDCRDALAYAATDCSHEHVHIERFDVGRCTQTGYHDAGEKIVCDDCGFEEVA